jgi:hypothetical protein
MKMKFPITFSLLIILSITFLGCEKCRTCTLVEDGMEMDESTQEYCGPDLVKIENKEFTSEENGQTKTRKYRCR